MSAQYNHARSAQSRRFDEPVDASAGPSSATFAVSDGKPAAVPSGTRTGLKRARRESWVDDRPRLIQLYTPDK